MSELENARARSHRTKVMQPMVVQSHTIGSTIRYPLVSENISKSGLLLVWDSKHQAPFRENTIIEMNIDTGSTFFEGPMNCLGKVVRKIEWSKKTFAYGIRIVQMEPKDQHTWEAMVNKLEFETHKKEPLNIGL